MARPTKKRTRSSPLRKLSKTLTVIASTAPTSSFAEGEKYVCSVCQLPVKLCTTDPMKRCEHMLLDGTQLQLLRRAGKQQATYCIRCGGQIPKRVLKENPLAELCHSCQNSTSRSRSKLSKRSKGVSL